MKQHAQELIDFIFESPSPYHVVKNAKQRLDKAGFTALDLRDKWDLAKGGKYYVTTNDTAVFAFIVGKGGIEEKGFKIVAAHTDAPTFKVKPSPDLSVEDKYLKLNVETYGAPILSTWFDRPLSLAGRVSLKSDNVLQPETRLVNFNRPIITIPNVAYHMNRAVNEGVAINKQIDAQPVLTLLNDKIQKEGFLVREIAKELNVKAEDILDLDVNVYEYQKGQIIGLNEEFISTGKLDDLAMVHAGLTAICDAEATEATNVLACFDNEEVGSRSKQGAGSPVFRQILERIVVKLGGGKEEFMRSIYNSFMISADMAHALHPNHPEKHDPVTRPCINRGPVIKTEGNQKYTTDSDASAVYEMLCKKAEIPYQKFVNRSDMAGGGTLGNVSAGQLDMRSVDIGNPMWAMHSVRETGGVDDHTYITRSFEEFYKL